MKRAAPFLCCLVLLAACGGGGGTTDARAVCADMKKLADSGAKVLENKDQWKPLIDKAARADVDSVKTNAKVAQTLLKASDKDKSVVDESFNKSLTKVAASCSALGSSFKPPETTTTSDPTN
jgi:hypothetical protein